MSSTSEDPKDAASRWKINRLFKTKSSADSNQEKRVSGHSKWSFGVLNDPLTVEVPGKDPAQMFLVILLPRLHMLTILL